MLFFFFNDTATTEIYTLSLHDALPISLFGAYRNPLTDDESVKGKIRGTANTNAFVYGGKLYALRSEEHTSELQSQSNLVCRLLLEKKKNTQDGKSANKHAHCSTDTGVP